MARWLVRLDGELIDLEEFPFWFPDGDVHAIGEEKGGRRSVYLTGPEFEGYKSAKEVHDAALRAVSELSGAIKLLNFSFRKPFVGEVIREHDDGTRDAPVSFVSVLIEGRSRAHAKIIGSQGPTRAQQLLAAADTDEDDHLRVALSIWAERVQTWARLYRVLDEMEKYLEMTVDQAKLCDCKERENFRLSANNPEISGDESRHASKKKRSKKPVPTHREISLQEADAFIGRLLEKLLRSI